MMSLLHVGTLGCCLVSLGGAENEHAQEAFVLLQTIVKVQHLGGAAANDTGQIVPFGGHEAALARTLYSFYMLSSCQQLLTPTQQAGSRCKHCSASGLRFEPGQLRVVKVNDGFQPKDLVAVVARVHPMAVESAGSVPGDCVVAIRGTQTLGNLLTDLAFAQAPFPQCNHCKVHAGWLRQWKLLKGGVLDELRGLGCNGTRRSLYLTGHSSGCAVSDYAALDLHLAHGYHLRTSIGFDCPKPGNKAFAQAFDAAFPTGVWKVQVDQDPIRHLPPRWTGYCDVGYAVHYSHGEAEGYTICGRGATLCGSDHPPRIVDNLAEIINNNHCAAPHHNDWRNQVYMHCDSRCDATLMEPEWDFLPENKSTQAPLRRRPRWLWPRKNEQH